MGLKRTFAATAISDAEMAELLADTEEFNMECGREGHTDGVEAWHLLERFYRAVRGHDLPDPSTMDVIDG